MDNEFKGATPEALGAALLRPTALKVIAGAPDRPLIIGNIEIQCYVLEDETRVLSQNGFVQALDTHVQASSKRSAGVVQMPAFLAKKNLTPFISDDLKVLYKPVLFNPPGGGNTAYGYRADLLPAVCNVYLKADQQRALRPSQAHVADRARVLMHGLAEVGIVALVDEATGYQDVRAKRALATILEKFIAKEFQPWTKTFPYEFYKEIYRLRGWSEPPKGVGSKGPRVIALWTNDFVYERIAPRILDELRRRNPKVPKLGARRRKHHQWFTPDFGHPKLKEHIAGVIMLMRAANDWDSFYAALDQAAPKFGHTIPIRLEDDDGRS